MTQYDPPPIPTSEPGSEVQQRKGCGCWAWGCLGIMLLGLLVVAGLGGGGWWWVTSQVAKYTAETPQELPSVEYAEEDLKALEQRLEDFSEKLKEGQPTDDLELTADDLNALISGEEKMRGRVFIRIRDGQVGGDVSIPTDGIPGGKGRYFNASAAFNVSMHNGVLIVTLADADVRGEKIPQEVLTALGTENLAKDLYKNPETAEVLRRLESVVVEDDRIVLRVRRDEAPAEPPREEIESTPDAVGDDPPEQPEPSTAIPQACAVV